MNLHGKVALITGAKGGLGNFVTEAFLAAGARVVGVSRSIQASEFPHAGFTAIAADLVTGEAARKLVEDVAARCGRIDALVHVMGGFAGGKSVAETDDATLEKMLDLNYRSAFFVARAVLPQMRRQGGGRILAVASRQAVEPGAMVGAYSASKAALEDRLYSYFNQYESFRAYYHVLQTSTENERGVALVELQIEATPRSGPSRRREGQVRFEFAAGKNGWQIVNFTPRDFFQ
ncbi:MAG: SDR family oxidoreductase [Acidobacteriia bacterium]|nr:SDR family oxidoreductase [Terriglobia bacterium]